MQGPLPPGHVPTHPQSQPNPQGLQSDPQLGMGAMPASLLSMAAPSLAGVSQAEPMQVCPLHQASDMEGVTLGASVSGLAAMSGSLPGAGQSNAWSPQPPAAPIQPLQSPVQVNGINFGVPIPAATAGTSQGPQSGGFWSGVPSGAAPDGGKIVYAAQATTAAQSPVKVGGFYFGVPSVAEVATHSSAPSSVPQTAAATPTPLLATPTRVTSSRGLWPKGFTPLTPASAVQPRKQQSQQQQQQQTPSPSTPDPVTPPHLVRGIWPQGFTPLIPTSPTPAQPGSQPHEQQQQSSAVDSKLEHKMDGGQDLSISGLRKMRTGFGMETVLADLNADEGPLLSSAAAAASQSDQAASKAGAAQLIHADVGNTYVSLKSSNKVAIDRHPVPVSTILADFLRAYSEYVKRPFDALRIAHQSRAVGRSQWGLSFSQLAWGTDVVLEVEFGDASAACPASLAAAATSTPPTAAATSASAAAVTPAAPAVKASVPEPGSTAGAVPADSSDNGTPSVHLTVTRAGAKPVSGSVPTAIKLGELLASWAQGQGLALEVIQVFHQGTAVDRACWGRSVAELSSRGSIVVDVQVQARQQPHAVSPGQQQRLHTCSGGFTSKQICATIVLFHKHLLRRHVLFELFLLDNASMCYDPPRGLCLNNRCYLAFHPSSRMKRPCSQQLSFTRAQLGVTVCALLQRR